MTKFLPPDLDESQLENPLWEYVCRVYAVGEIKTLCLHLQNNCGANINMVLTSAWAAQQRWVLDWQVLVALIEPWERQIIKPVRAIRNALSNQAPLQKRLRDKLLAAELVAEQFEIAQLYHLLTNIRPYQQSSGAADTVGLLEQNLLSYFHLIDPPAAWQEPVARTAAILAAN